MKLVLFILVVFFIVSCSTQKVSVNESKKLLQIKYTLEGDTLNTFTQSFTRVYKFTEIYRVNFGFTVSEIDRIIKVIEEEDFFSLPDSLPMSEIVFFPTGGGYGQHCEILLNGQRKSVFWVDLACNQDSQEYKRLRIVYLAEFFQNAIR